jgi:hypothetical protein
MAFGLSVDGLADGVEEGGVEQLELDVIQGEF